MPSDEAFRFEEVRRLIDRGLARYGRGELEKALEVWNEALRLDPGNEEAKTLIDFVHAKMGVESGSEGKGPDDRTTDPTIPSFDDDWEGEFTNPEEPKETIARVMKAERLATGAGTPPVRPTLESQIPGFLAPITDPGWQTPGPTPDDGIPQRPMFKEDTRRLGSEPHAVSPGLVPATADAPTHDSASGVRLRAADLVDGCRAEFERGDMEAASTLAEEALRAGESAPPPGIAEVIEPARPLFETVFEAYVGPAQGIPVLATSPSSLAGQDMDHRAGFLMSLIDGTMTIEQLTDVAGMPRFETMRILAVLLRAKAIQLL